MPVMSATNVFHARRFAEDRGDPLNFMVTINWDLLSICETASTKMHRSLRSRVARAWKYEAEKHMSLLGSFDYVEVHENPNGIPNTHWVIRVPLDKRAWFKSKVEKFLKKLVSMSELPSNAVHYTDEIYAGGQLFKYLCEGVSPAYANYFNLRHKDQGTVYGRRSCVSRSIGRTKRKKSAWYRRRRASR